MVLYGVDSVITKDEVLFMDLSLKKPFRWKVIEEGKEESLMASDKEDILGHRDEPAQCVVSETQEDASAVFTWSSDPP